ncbi:hypothetical protein DLAC_02088 [Tieghemostelium lacteum]|uniref:Ubiquitin-like domain-containing protein n=1 Tax=Tieghemostelium lacteum TaxID=361077 RepID=A0A152A452_TIELA|nr:hypothetical protein DLAC_02088 [Tieghemostelium lacteum]|eukprot:KYR01010.1 hypothetical protein DLAC_02088 [Tieghemostelium lacteum]
MSDDNNNNNIETKAEVKPEEEHINIKVVNANGQETVFKIKKSTKMGKLIANYCSRNGLSGSKVRFLTPEGTRIQDESTPTELGLEDGDKIDVFVEQQGGSFY